MTRLAAIGGTRIDACRSMPKPVVAFTNHAAKGQVIQPRSKDAAAIAITPNGARTSSSRICVTTLTAIDALAVRDFPAACVAAMFTFEATTRRFASTVMAEMRPTLANALPTAIGTSSGAMAAKPASIGKLVMAMARQASVISAWKRTGSRAASERTGSAIAPTGWATKDWI